MPHFRKKPIVVHAVQYNPEAGHSDVRRIDIDGVHFCDACGEGMYRHGKLKTLEGEMTVCPGDWIITGVRNERYPCKHDVFFATYEPVESPNEPRPE